MALPKRKIDISQNKTGKERIDELMAMTNENTTFLPQAITIKDLDIAFREYVRDTHLKVLSKDKKVIPVFFLTKEKWAEFAMTWKYTDNDGNIVMPFITILRNEAPKQGTNDNIKYRIYQNKKYDYLKIPVYENGVYTENIYRIPQPTPIDLKYEVRIFTHFMDDLNALNTKVQKMFAQGLSYTSVGGYFMPIKLNDVSSESTMNDYEGQRFYCQVFTMTVLGFLQDPDDFEVVKSIRRIVVNEIVEQPKKEN